jgi:hypothetical protein
MKKYFLTSEQISRLIEIYPTTLTQNIADEFGVSICCIRNKAFDLGLHKDKKWIADVSRNRMNNPDHPGRKAWIKKGATPPNKGKKQTEYMTAAAIERTAKTRFKKGNIPPNHKPIGFERISEDGYRYVKTKEPRTFELLHRVVWIEHHGSIEKGYNVQFKDGNRQNCNIENLYLISRQKQLKEENSLHAKYPKEVQLAIQAKGTLSRQINKLIKQNKEE